MIRELALKIYIWFKSKYVAYATSKVLSRLYKEYSNGVNLKPLSPEQESSIQAYWQPLIGDKVSPKWHQLIYSITGVFKPEYMPFEIAMRIQENLSPSKFQRPFDDKGLYHQLLIGFNFPIRVGLCSHGVYYLPETKGLIEVSFDVFIKGLDSISDCIIKPNLGTDGGRGVITFEVNNGIVVGTNLDLRSFLNIYQNRYGLNYSIERKIHECKNLQVLNPTSCNTLRVHTYRDRKNYKIKLLSSYIRIGKRGQVVDNAHSGGYCARIDEDGYLDRLIRVYPYEYLTQTESGINVSHYAIDDYQKIIDTTKNAHSLLPMFDLIGWDVTLDEKGKVIIIEFNPNPDMRMEQCIFDYTCLGEYQKEIIRRVFSNI